MGKKKIKKRNKGSKGKVMKSMDSFEQLHQRMISEQKEEELKEKEKELRKKEEELREREERLKGMEEEAGKRQEELEQLREEQVRLLEEVKRKQRELIERERWVIEKENEAREGFLKEQERIVGQIKRELEALSRSEMELEERIVELAGEAGERIAESIKEAGERRIKEVAGELERIRDVHREQLELVLQENRELTGETFEKVRETIDTFVNESLMRLKEEISREFEELEAKEREVIEREKEAARREREAELEKEMARVQQKHYEERLEQEKMRLEQEYEEIRRKRDEYHERVLELEGEIERMKEARVLIDGRGEEVVAQELRELMKENRRLKKRIERMMPESEWKRLRELESENEKLNEMVGRLQNERDALGRSVADLEETQRELERNRRLVETYEARIGELEEHLERLKEIYQKPAEREARIAALKEGVFEELDELNVQDEKQWLEGIVRGIEEIGFSFPKRLIYAYHTSLKVAGLSPLVVLAGPSGTGKSALGMLYARFGGLYFQSVQVKPDWDSPESLLGYYHPIEKAFNAPELSRAIYQMGEEGFKERLLLVLLDEMNLAHVEQYLADVLSLLEERRTTGQEVGIELDLGPGIKEKERLILGPNILWTGTINVDESTIALSDKVVDRSNVIYFPSPESFVDVGQRDAGKVERVLPLRVWKGWIRKPDKVFLEKVREYKEMVELINEYLKGTGRSLGHRVWRAMMGYMVNYPGVTQVLKRLQEVNRKEESAKEQKEQQEIQKKKEQVEKKLKALLDQAFEDQIVQKVFPKLKGLETRGRVAEALKNIGEIIEDLAVREDFERAMENPYGSFMVISADYLKDNKDG